MFFAEIPTHVIIMYIDPGAGSIIFQAVIGGIMVVGMTARVYWRKVRSLFVRSPR